MLVLLIGFGLDLLLGDPLWLWHPVMGIGKLITGTEHLLRRVFSLPEEAEAAAGRKKAAGVLLVLIVLVCSVALPVLLLWAAGQVSRLLRFILECVMCYQLLAVRSLRTESMKVYTALRQGDVPGARRAVSMIVGRDTKRLDTAGITRAAVETVAENTSDGVAAPLLYMALFGAAGGFFYKAVNTMDSMVGYQNDRYLYLGRAAAKLDDAANYLPSRICAWVMIAAAAITGLDAGNALRIYRRDRRKHASPNSAQTEAVCAGALGVMLGGDAWYFGKLHHKPTIGDPLRAIEAEDIPRACRLMVATSCLLLLLVLLVFFLLSLIYTAFSLAV